MRSAERDPNRKFEHKQRVQYAQEFRAARAGALRDAEAFEEHLLIMERLGTYLSNSRGGLNEFERLLREIAVDSALASEAARAFPAIHSDFSVLYQEARIGRNDAMHEGAIARHLARNAQIESALRSCANPRHLAPAPGVGARSGVYLCGRLRAHSVYRAAFWCSSL